MVNLINSFSLFQLNYLERQNNVDLIEPLHWQLNETGNEILHLLQIHVFLLGKINSKPSDYYVIHRSAYNTPLTNINALYHNLCNDPVAFWTMLICSQPNYMLPNIVL